MLPSRTMAQALLCLVLDDHMFPELSRSFSSCDRDPSRGSSAHSLKYFVGLDVESHMQHALKCV